MATHLVTGYAGSEHIKSEDQGSFNASFFGTGQFVMEAGNQLEASILDNNTVRILDGDILMKGRHIRINPNTYEDMIIETGTAGVNRCDLIVMEYSKDATTGIEKASLKVLKGAETTGTATAPAYTDGDILTGATLNQMPLYNVLIEGVVLVEIICLFNTIPTYETLAERYRQKFIKDCQTHLDSLGVLDTMEEIEANTQSDQLAGALSLKEMNATHKSDIAAVNKSMTEGIKGVEDKVGILMNGFTPEVKDANLCVTTGNIAIRSGEYSSWSNLPVNGGYGILRINNGGSMITQEFDSQARGYTFRRISVDGGATWTGWDILHSNTKIVDGDTEMYLGSLTIQKFDSQEEYEAATKDENTLYAFPDETEQAIAKITTQIGTITEFNISIDYDESKSPSDVVKEAWGQIEGKGFCIVRVNNGYQAIAVVYAPFAKYGAFFTFGYNQHKVYYHYMIDGVWTKGFFSAEGD